MEAMAHLVRWFTEQKKRVISYNYVKWPEGEYDRGRDIWEQFFWWDIPTSTNEGSCGYDGIWYGDIVDILDP